jgi:hypothetical protein
MIASLRHFIVVAGRECIGGRDPAATSAVLDKVGEIIDLLRPEPGSDAAGTDWASLVKFRAELLLKRKSARKVVAELGPLVEPRHGPLRRSTTIHILFATALENDGRKAEAAMHMQSAIKADVDAFHKKPRAFSRLARLYYELGKKEIAAVTAQVYLSTVQENRASAGKKAPLEGPESSHSKKHEIIATGILVAIYGPDSKEIRIQLDGIEERHGRHARHEACILASRWRQANAAAEALLPETSSMYSGYENGESPLYQLLHGPFKPVPASSRDRVRANLGGLTFEIIRKDFRPGRPSACHVIMRNGVTL